MTNNNANKTNNNININASEKNTKNELLSLISRLKKTQILNIIYNFNKVNNIKNNEPTSSLKVEKKKIKIPKNIKKKKLVIRKSDNEHYQNI